MSQIHKNSEFMYIKSLQKENIEIPPLQVDGIDSKEKVEAPNR